MRNFASFAFIGASLVAAAPQYGGGSQYSSSKDHEYTTKTTSSYGYSKTSPPHEYSKSTSSYWYSKTSYPSKPSSYPGYGMPNQFPLPDGFPNPNPQQLRDIEVRARGSLPNGPPPPPNSISPEGLINLRLIQFNENFEVAFFNSLLHNITSNVSGFEFKDSKKKKIIIDALTAVLAQEELHAINAGNGLKSQNQDPIEVCKYMFPTTTFDNAIALAQTFTDVVLGTLQDVIQIFAENNDNGLTRGVASVVGQEGEQNGLYRLLQKKIPSAQPFLTTSVRDFAFTALQASVVPGSCPNIDLISRDLKIFGTLNLLTKNIAPKDQNLEFSFDVNSLKQSNIPNVMDGHYGPGYDWSRLSLVYISAQNTPIVEKLMNVKLQGTVVTFDAFFPFNKELLNGLTLAAVTSNMGPFANATEVRDASLFAPAPIEVN